MVRVFFRVVPAFLPSNSLTSFFGAITRHRRSSIARNVVESIALLRASTAG